MKTFLSSVYADIRRGENLEIYLAILVSIALTGLGLANKVEFNVLAAGMLSALTLLVFSALTSRRDVDKLADTLKKVERQTNFVADALSKAPINTRPGDVIRSLDSLGSLETFLAGSNQIFMSGTTLLTRTSMLRMTYKRMLEQGCNFKFIVLDPTSPILPLVAMGLTSSADVLRNEINTVLDMFRDLKNYAERKHTAGKFEFAAFSYIPGLTLMRTKNSSSGKVVIHVEVPGYRRGLWERPVFRLTHADTELFAYFDQVCTDLWADATAELLAATVSSNAPEV